MSIANKLNNEYKNIVKIIKNEKNKVTKMKLIGNLALDLKVERCILPLSELLKCSRSFIKKSIDFVKNDCQKQLSLEFRGRKRITEKYPELPEDIKKVIADNLSVDPHFKSEKQYIKLSVVEIKKQLVQTGKYTENSFSNSTLNNLINQMGYGLKKVQKTKPLKKIEETDAIFENVHQRKEIALSNGDIVLISIDTKDKVLIGPFSRNGKNRVLVQAVDHELTNECLIPFGILDIKKNTPYFFNFQKKPTSLDLVECIEEFYVEQYKNTNVKKLMILLDNGPDNSGVRTMFLKGLINISKQYNLEIELVYYPPYHSKYNPVERLWARLENIWNGFLLETVEICLNFMKNLTWKNVKSVTKMKEVKFEKGLRVEKQEMKHLEENHIFRTEGIKKWSVLITP